MKAAINAPVTAVRSQIDGVLLLDKPLGISSNAALQKARIALGAARAGHTGTLDPMASGLLVVCFGEATKFSPALFAAGKSYSAVIGLGRVTGTGDSEGEVVSESTKIPTFAEVGRVLEKFRGPVMQTPPMHSALKHKGKALYTYARAGIEVERAPREVTIDNLELQGMDGKDLKVAVSCSKGTYIRALAVDIGEALECGAYLKALRRTRVGPYDLNQAVPLSRLQAMNLTQRLTCLRPVDSLVSGFPRKLLDARAVNSLFQGRALPQPEDSPAGPVSLYREDDQRFIGLGEVTGEGLLWPRRLIAAG